MNYTVNEHCFTCFLVEIQSQFFWVYTQGRIGESQIMYAQLFPWLTVPVYQQQCIRIPVFCTFLNIWIFTAFLIFAILLALYCDFNLHSLLSDVEQLYICLLTTQVSTFLKCLFRCLSILNLDISCLTDLQEFFIYFTHAHTHTLTHTYVYELQLSSSNLWFTFHFLSVSKNRSS